MNSKSRHHAGNPLPVRGTRRARLARLLLVSAAVLAAVAGAAVLYRCNPVSSPYYPRCLFHEMTGLYCPGCGSTRAMHQLLHGHVAAALRSNVLTVSALPLLLMALGKRALRTAGLTVPRGRPIAAAWIWVLFGTILAFWIARNVPAAPFRWLAPPG